MLFDGNNDYMAAGANGMVVWGSAWGQGIGQAGSDSPSLQTPFQIICTLYVHLGKPK